MKGTETQTFSKSKPKKGKKAKNYLMNKINKIMKTCHKQGEIET